MSSKGTESQENKINEQLKKLTTMKEQKITLPTMEEGRCEFTLTEALRRCEKELFAESYIKNMVVQNVVLRDGLRKFGAVYTARFLWEMSDKTDKMGKALERFVEKWGDAKLADYDIQLRSIHDDFTLLGHTFHGLEDMKSYMRHQEGANKDVFVTCTLDSYPCFDSSDYLCENRFFQNYIVRKHPIGEEETKRLEKLPSWDNYNKVTEVIPDDMLPVVYYAGDGNFMLVATEKENTDSQTTKNRTTMTNATKEKNSETKTKVFNVIILDKSGSMSCIRKAAIEGFNETLAGIKKAQEKYAETQEHFVSLVAFCSCETRQIFDRVPAAEARPLTEEDYEPCCCTPLYDAMGFTLTSMRKHVKEAGDAMAVVTIITDGLENASHEYTGKAVKKLVEELKGEGWTFTYMGANQDSVEVAFTLSIRNARNFDYSDEGTRCCMAKDSSTRMATFDRLHVFKKSCSSSKMDLGDRLCKYSELANEAFDEEEKK